jgi:hypothetical protein
MQFDDNGFLHGSKSWVGSLGGLENQEEGQEESN